MEKDLTQLSIDELHAGYQSGAFGVRDVVDAYRKNIQEKNNDIRAYLELFADDQESVAYAQSLIDAGTMSPMVGVPIAIKDNILIQGKHVTAASRILENYIAPYDAHVITLLKKQGAIILGRTNMDEFAMGSSTETSAYGITKNPLDMRYVPGGSSGGSAAAVAMYGALVALGSDTGGSVRQPASFCGCVGLSPTYGSISRSGLIAMASSLDVIGPLARTVADAEKVFYALAHHDSNDSTCLPDSLRTEHTPKSEVRRIGVPRSLLALEGIDQDVRDNFHHACTLLEQAGYTLVDIEMPLLPFALPMYYIIQPAEASTNLARYDGVRFGKRIERDTLWDTYEASRTVGFGAEVKRRILLGTYVLSHGYYDAYYGKATQLRDALRASFEKVFADVDVIITPTTPSTAFQFGAKNDNPLSMYMSDIFTVPANIAGIPALSVPSGKNEQGLPYGLHIMGPALGEGKLFTLGKDFESRV